MFEKRATISIDNVEILHNPKFEEGNFDFVKSLDLKVASKSAEVKKDGDTLDFDLEAEESTVVPRSGSGVVVGVRQLYGCPADQANPAIFDPALGESVG